MSDTPVNDSSPLTLDNPATTEQPAATAALRLAARSAIGLLREELNALDPVKFPQGHKERTQRIDRITALTSKAFAPEPSTPAGPTWRDRRQFRLESAEMRKEAENYVPGDPTRAEIFREVADHAAEFHKDDAVPGAVRWEDVERAPSVQPWAPDVRSDFRLWGEASGVTPTEAIKIAGTWEQERTAAQTSAPIDWELRWGSSFAAKNAHLERALKYISDQRYDQLADAGLRNAPKTVEMLVRLGERLGKTR